MNWCGSFRAKATLSTSIVAIGLLVSPIEAATPPRADLRVSFAGAPTRVLLEKDVAYRVAVANRGPRSATRVRLVLSVAGPAVVTAASGTGRCTRATATRSTCAVARIAARRSITVVLTVRPSALGTISVTAAATSDAVDPQRRNNRIASTAQVLRMNTVQGRGIRSTLGDAGRSVVTTEIDARSDPTTGETAGTFAIRYAAISVSPARGSDLRGRVVCLTVEGNRAMIGGVIESSNSPAIPAGWAVQFAITDNGDPGTGRDLDVAYLGRDVTPTCEPRTGDQLPLLDGNYTVVDGEP